MGSGGLFGVDTAITRQDQQTTTTDTTITAGGNATITAGGDATLIAPAVTAGGAAAVTAGGDVALLTTRDSAQTRDTRREEDLLWWNTSDTGRTAVTRTPTRITAAGGVQIVAGGQVVADYVPTGDFAGGIAQLATAPGLAWMGDLAARDDVVWQEATEAFEAWDHADQGLTEAGALLVTVVASYALGPGIGELAATLGGNSAVVTAAFEAGLTNLATQTSVALVNNQGNLAGALHDLGSQASLRNLATSLVSAGLSSHVVSTAGLSTALHADLVRTTVNAPVDTALNGGDLLGNLTDGWTDTMVLAGLGAVQERIGDFAAENNLAEGSIPHALAHAVAGGLAAELAGESFADGAVGAAAAALAANAVGDSGLSPDRQIELQNLIATTAVLLSSDGDADAAEFAGDIGSSAHENNYLSHSELSALYDGLVACEATADPQACHAPHWQTALDAAEARWDQVRVECRGDTACLAPHRAEYMRGAALRRAILNGDWTPGENWLGVGRVGDSLTWDIPAETAAAQAFITDWDGAVLLLADALASGVCDVAVCGGYGALGRPGTIDGITPAQRASATGGRNAAENNGFWFIVPVLIAALEATDKALTARDAYELGVALEGCNAGNQVACTTAESLARDFAISAGVEVTIGSVVPGSRVAGELLIWVRRNAGADTVRAIDNAAESVDRVPDDWRPVRGVGAQVSTPRGFTSYRTPDGDIVHVSPAGLRYGSDPRFGNRVDHVLSHTTPNPNRPGTHSVFNMQGDDALSLVDEAWMRRGVPDPNDSAAFVVDMGRVIGTAGETSIRVIVRPGTNQIPTAYPF